MGRGKTAMKKIESATSRHVTFCKRRSGLFKKARELSVLCDAEVAIILFAANGKISEFASSNMEKILRRFSTCLKSRNLPALGFKPEEAKEQVAEEVDAHRQEAQEPKLKQWKLLGKDLTHMGLHELLVLEQKLTEGQLMIKDKKVQILMEQLEQSKMQEQQALQKNQSLQRLVGELQGLFPSATYAVPLSVHFPDMEDYVGSVDGTFLPSTSFAAPLAIDNGSETEGRVGSADKEFFPSTSSAASLAFDNGPRKECITKPAEEDSDTTLALAPTWGWWTNADTRGETRSSNPHTQVGRR